MVVLRKNMKHASLQIVLAILAAALLAAPVQEAQAPAPVQQIYITAERFSYTPAQIRIKKGSIVEIIAESEDTSHGFRIPEAGIEGIIPARGKGEMRLRFKAVESGTYIFECSRPCGAGHNTMRGVLIVED